MIDTHFLQVLCCPETHQRLRLADPQLLNELNKQISEGSIRNRAGTIIRETVDSGLVREDGRILYPVRKDIPVMLIDEGIPLT